MTQQIEAADEVIDYLRELFVQRGDSLYGGEAVTQLEHGLQAAYLAEQQHASPQLIAAALLHDVGHLLHDLPESAPDEGIDDVHEHLGAKWLADKFPDSVVLPIRMHVAAKRYLCAVDPTYRSTLSEPSEISLQLQGGPMTADECEEFRTRPHYLDAISLRRWDDQAKTAGLATPGLDHFLGSIRQSLSVSAS